MFITFLQIIAPICATLAILPYYCWTISGSSWEYIAQGLVGFTNATILIGFLVYVGEIVGARYRGLVISASVACRIFNGHLWPPLFATSDFNRNRCLEVMLIVTVVVAIFNYRFTFESDTFKKLLTYSAADSSYCQDTMFEVITEVTVSQTSSMEAVDQIEVADQETDFIENHILDNQNLDAVSNCKLIAKVMTLVLAYRLPVFIVRNTTFVLIKTSFLLAMHKYASYADFVVGVLTIFFILVMGLKTGTRHRRMDIAIPSVFAIALLFAVNSALIFIFFWSKSDWLHLSIIIINILIEISLSFGMYHLAEQLMVELLPVRRRGLLMAVIMSVESILYIVTHIMIYYFDVVGEILLELVYLTSTLLCVLSGYLMHTKLESLYNLFS